VGTSIQNNPLIDDISVLLALVDEQGIRQTSQDGILATAKAFYGNLYSPKQSEPAAAEHILSLITKKISDRTATKLVLPITREEVLRLV